MTKSELEKRTKAFAVSVIHFVNNLPKNKGAGRVIAAQLLRSAMSIGANYREANRAQSSRDFVHKIAISEKEAAETLYWIELLQDVKLGNPDQLDALAYECDQLVAIFTRIGKTIKINLAAKSEVRNPKFEFPS